MSSSHRIASPGQVKADAKRAYRNGAAAKCADSAPGQEISGSSKVKKFTDRREDLQVRSRSRLFEQYLTLSNGDSVNNDDKFGNKNQNGEAEMLWEHATQAHDARLETDSGKYTWNNS